MTKKKEPHELKRKCPANEGKSGYWEPDLDLVAALESIEIDEPEFAKTGRPRYWTEERALQVAKELIEWAKHPDALNTTRFMCPKGLDKTACNKLCDVYPRFRKFYIRAKELVGANREAQAGKKFDSGMAKKYAGTYDTDYRDWEIQLKGYEAQGKAIININARGMMDEPEVNEGDE